MKARRNRLGMMETTYGSLQEFSAVAGKKLFLPGCK